MYKLNESHAKLVHQRYLKFDFVNEATYYRHLEQHSKVGKFRLQRPERVDPPSSQRVGRPLGGRLSGLLVQHRQQQESDDGRQREIRRERARLLQPRQFDTIPKTSRHIHVDHIDVKPQAAPARRPWSGESEGGPRRARQTSGPGRLVLVSLFAKSEMENRGLDSRAREDSYGISSQ